MMKKVLGPILRNTVLGRCLMRESINVHLQKGVQRGERKNEEGRKEGGKEI